MNPTIPRSLLLRVVLLGAALAAQPSCVGSHAPNPPEEGGLTWNSPRILAIKEEYKLLQQENSRKQQANPSEGKHIYCKTVQACRRLFAARLSSGDMRELVASCGALPVRFRDREEGFHALLLEYMVEVFVALGDRETLVELLSTRFVSHLGGTDWIEFYLAIQEDRVQSFCGNRLKSPITVLGEAYNKCRNPVVRTEIAAAVHRGFDGVGIPGKDDTEFVANAMQWYENHKDYLIVHPLYSQSDVRPLCDDLPQGSASQIPEIPGGKRLLFKTATSPKTGRHGVLAVLPIWLLHVTMAVVLSAPILWFGRTRVHWQAWELLAVTLPFGIWAILMLSPFAIERKTVSNLIEAGYLAAGVPVVALLRVGVGSHIPQRVCASVVLFLLCIAAVAMFFIVPPCMP